MADRFERFTERARRVLTLAQEETLRFNHNYLGTEHLLLGLVREGDGVAARVLANLGVEPNKVRSAVEFIIGRGDGAVVGQVNLTPGGKKAIELAVAEAQRMNHHYVGTEHLLLGPALEGEGIAAGVLRSLGVELEDIRAEVSRILSVTLPPAARDVEQSGSASSYPDALSDALGAVTAAKDTAIAQRDYEQVAMLRDLEVRLSQMSATRSQDRSRPNAARGRAAQPGTSAREGDMADRFDKFTERARRVLTHAQEEAQRFNHNYIGTEHLLLGLLREEEGVAAAVLTDLGVRLEDVRSAVEFIIGRGDRAVLGEIGLTPRSRKVIELAVDEARRLNHHYIGTEHLLLGLLREGEGIAAGVLESLGVNLDGARTETVRILSGGQPQSTSVARRAVRGGAEWVYRAERTVAELEFRSGLAIGMALSPSAREALQAAWTSAQTADDQRIRPEHLLLALLDPKSEVSEALRGQQGDPDALYAAVRRLLDMGEQEEAAGDSGVEA